MIDAISTLHGNVKVKYELQKCIEQKMKWNVQIYGFSGNWARIKVEIQEEGNDFKHYTLNKKGEL